VELDWTCRCFGASTVTGGRLEDCAQASVTRSTDSKALTVARQTAPMTFFFDTPTQDTPTTRPTSSACSLGLLYSTEMIATSACALEFIEGLNFRIDRKSDRAPSRNRHWARYTYSPPAREKFPILLRPLDHRLFDRLLRIADIVRGIDQRDVGQGLRKISGLTPFAGIEFFRQ
jgi:hypothetical protein